MLNVAFLGFAVLASSATAQISIPAFPSGTPGCVGVCINAKISEISSLAPGATTLAQLCAAPNFISAYNQCLMDNCGSQYAQALQIGSSICIGSDSSSASAAQSTSAAAASSTEAAEQSSVATSASDSSTLGSTSSQSAPGTSDILTSGTSTSTSTAQSASPSTTADGGVTSATSSTAAPVSMSSQGASPANASATATATLNSSPQPAGPSAGAIAGGAVGGVVVLAAVILLLCLLMRRRRRQRQQARFIVDGRSMTPTQEMTEAHPYIDEPTPANTDAQGNPHIKSAGLTPPVQAVTPPFVGPAVVPASSGTATPSVADPSLTSRNEKRPLLSPPATSDSVEMPEPSSSTPVGTAAISLQEASTADLVEVLNQRLRSEGRGNVDQDAAEPPSYSAT